MSYDACKKGSCIGIGMYDGLCSSHEIDRLTADLAAARAERDEVKDLAEGFQSEAADLRGERDEAVDLLGEVVEHFTSEWPYLGRDGNAPTHGHGVPGIWDPDNGAKAGTACAWCATWKKIEAFRARRALASTGRAADSGAKGEGR